MQATRHKDWALRNTQVATQCIIQYRYLLLLNDDNASYNFNYLIQLIIY